MEPSSAKDRLITAITEYVTEAGVPASECDPDFLVKMLAAMMVSYHKYGLVHQAYPTKFKATDDIRARLSTYLKTGNLHFLVDISNFAMIEAMHPALEGAEYLTNDSDDSPGRVSRETRGLVHQDNDGNRINRT